MTPGFVGADLKALAREAGMLAVSRIVDLHPKILTDENIGSENGNKKKNEDLKIINFVNKDVTMKAEVSLEESRGAAASAGPVEMIVIKNSIQMKGELPGCDSSMIIREETSREFLQNSERVNGVNYSDALNLSGDVTYCLDYPNAITIKTENNVEKIESKLESSQAIVEGDGLGEGSSEGRGKGVKRGANEESNVETSGETSAYTDLNEKRLSLPLSLPSLFDVAVEMSDFLTAAKSVQPTAKREGFAVVPDVTWGELHCLLVSYLW